MYWMCKLFSKQNKYEPSELYVCSECVASLQPTDEDGKLIADAEHKTSYLFCVKCTEDTFAATDSHWCVYTACYIWDPIHMNAMLLCIQRHMLSSVFDTIPAMCYLYFILRYFHTLCYLQCNICYSPCSLQWFIFCDRQERREVDVRRIGIDPAILFTPLKPISRPQAGGSVCRS